jgi:hypothetical protein
MAEEEQNPETAPLVADDNVGAHRCFTALSNPLTCFASSVGRRRHNWR